MGRRDGVQEPPQPPPRRQLRGRLQQRRSRRRRDAEGARHQHARRPHRGDGRPHLGPDPRNHAPADRGRGARAQRALDRLASRTAAGPRAARADPRPVRRRQDRPGGRTARAAVRASHSVHGAHPKPDFERETGAARVEPTRLLAESDIVSLHVPASPETKGIINGETLARMKRGAILINTSRGDLIREEALAMALERGHLGAAGLDVYTDEPAIHPRLLAAPRTVLLPHIGSATEETRRNMAAIAVANVQSVLSGKPPLTPVY